ncbi:MAG: GNAT family N-acetyltransferase [Chloroflexi bacterium]|nr:GNAT family N-acetyltransferase [Chloroflexota bacterium]
MARAGRPASAAVRSCVRAAYARYVERIGREPAPMSADYEDLIDRGDVYVLQPRASEEIYGVLVLRVDGHVLWIENVAVSPEYQRRGYGRQLLDFAEQHARTLGITELRLYTNELMAENLVLYRRLGYVEVDRRLDDGFRRVFMRKRLGPTPPRGSPSGCPSAGRAPG